MQNFNLLKYGLQIKTMETLKFEDNTNMTLIIGTSQYRTFIFEKKIFITGKFLLLLSFLSSRFGHVEKTACLER